MSEKFRSFIQSDLRRMGELHRESEGDLRELSLEALERAGGARANTKFDNLNDYQLMNHFRRAIGEEPIP